MQSPEVSWMFLPAEGDMLSHRRARSSDDASLQGEHVPAQQGVAPPPSSLYHRGECPNPLRLSQLAERAHKGDTCQGSTSLREISHRRVGSDSASNRSPPMLGSGVKGPAMSASRPPLPRHRRAHSTIGAATWQAKGASSRQGSIVLQQPVTVVEADGVTVVHHGVNSVDTVNRVRGGSPHRQSVTCSTTEMEAFCPSQPGTCHMASSAGMSTNTASRATSARWRYPTSLSCPEAIQVWEVADEASHESRVSLGFHAVGSAPTSGAQPRGSEVEPGKVDLPWSKDGFGCSIWGVPEVVREASREGEKIIITDSDDEFTTTRHISNRVARGTQGGSGYQVGTNVLKHTVAVQKPLTKRPPAYPSSHSCPSFLQGWNGMGGDGSEGGEGVGGFGGELTWQDVAEADQQSTYGRGGEARSGRKKDVPVCHGCNCVTTPTLCCDQSQCSQEPTLAQCQAGKSCCLHSATFRDIGGSTKLLYRSSCASCQPHTVVPSSCIPNAEAYSSVPASSHESILAASNSSHPGQDPILLSTVPQDSVRNGPTASRHVAYPPTRAAQDLSTSSRMHGRRRWASDQTLWHTGNLLDLTSPPDSQADTCHCQLAGFHVPQGSVTGCQGVEPNLNKRIFGADVASAGTIHCLQSQGHRRAPCHPLPQEGCVTIDVLQCSSKIMGNHSNLGIIGNRIPPRKGRAHSVDSAPSLIDFSIPEHHPTPPSLLLQISPCQENRMPCGTPTMLPHGSVVSVQGERDQGGDVSPVVIEVSPGIQDSQVNKRAAFPTTPLSSPVAELSGSITSAAPNIHVSTPDSTKGRMGRDLPPTPREVLQGKPPQTQDAPLTIEVSPASSTTGTPMGPPRDAGTFARGTWPAHAASVQFPQSKSCPGRPILITVDEDPDLAPETSNVPQVSADMAQRRDGKTGKIADMASVKAPLEMALPTCPEAAAIGSPKPRRSARGPDTLPVQNGKVLGTFQPTSRKVTLRQGPNLQS